MGVIGAAANVLFSTVRDKVQHSQTSHTLTHTHTQREREREREREVIGPVARLLLVVSLDDAAKTQRWSVVF